MPCTIHETGPMFPAIAVMLWFDDADPELWRRLEKLTCSRCGQLDCTDGPWCDQSPEEQAEDCERWRTEAGTDADYDEVSVEIPGWSHIEFPGDLELDAEPDVDDGDDLWAWMLAA